MGRVGEADRPKPGREGGAIPGAVCFAKAPPPGRFATTLPMKGREKDQSFIRARPIRTASPVLTASAARATDPQATAASSAASPPGLMA